MKKSIIPQIIIPVSIDAVNFLQAIYPCTECLKECKSVWVSMKNLEYLGNTLSDELSTEYYYLVVLSRKFKIEKICFSALKDLHALKDCNLCIHFHDAIIK